MQVNSNYFVLYHSTVRSIYTELMLKFTDAQGKAWDKIYLPKEQLTIWNLRHPLENDL